MFYRNKQDFLRQYATMNEIWIHHFTSGSSWKLGERCTEAHFESKNKSFYKHETQMLEKHWNDYIAIKGDYVIE